MSDECEIKLTTVFRFLALTHSLAARVDYFPINFHSNARNSRFECFKAKNCYRMESVRKVGESCTARNTTEPGVTFHCNLWLFTFPFPGDFRDDCDSDCELDEKQESIREKWDIFRQQTHPLYMYLICDFRKANIKRRKRENFSTNTNTRAGRWKGTFTASSTKAPTREWTYFVSFSISGISLPSKLHVTGSLLDITATMEWRAENCSRFLIFNNLLEQSLWKLN